VTTDGVPSQFEDTKGSAPEAPREEEDGPLACADPPGRPHGARFTPALELMSDDPSAQKYRQRSRNDETTPKPEVCRTLSQMPRHTPRRSGELAEM